MPGFVVHIYLVHIKSIQGTTIYSSISKNSSEFKRFIGEIKDYSTHNALPYLECLNEYATIKANGIQKTNHRSLALEIG